MDARTAQLLARVAGEYQFDPVGTPGREVIADLISEARSLAGGEPCDIHRCEEVITKLCILGLGQGCQSDSPLASELETLLAYIRADACAQREEPAP